MIETKINVENLKILSILSSPGIPCSYFVGNYFEYSKNNFQSIKDNERLYDGVFKAFNNYCKIYFPDIYVLYNNTVKNSNEIECIEDVYQQGDVNITHITHNKECSVDNLENWEKYNETIDHLISLWKKL